MARRTTQAIAQDLDVLYNDMSGANVRSMGLKPGVHQEWLIRLRRLIDELNQPEEKPAEPAIP